MLPFRLVVNGLHGRNKFATVKTGRNFYYLKHVESPADDAVLIPQTLLIIYRLIAILSASFSSYVKLVYLFIFSNFVNVLFEKLHNFTVVFNIFL